MLKLETESPTAPSKNKKKVQQPVAPKCASKVSSHANEEVAFPSSFSKKLYEVTVTLCQVLSATLSPTLLSLWPVIQVCHWSLHFAAREKSRVGSNGKSQEKWPRPPFFSLDLSVLFHFPFAHKKGLLFLLENTRPQGVSGFRDFATSPVHLFLKDRYFSVTLSW